MKNNFLKKVSCLVLLSFFHMQLVWAASGNSGKYVSKSKQYSVDQSTIFAPSLNSGLDQRVSNPYSPLETPSDKVSWEQAPKFAIDQTKVSTETQPETQSSDNLSLKPSDVPPPSSEVEASNNIKDNKVTKNEILKTVSANLPLAAVLDVYSTSLSGIEAREISNAFRREVKNTGKFLVYNRSEMRKALGKNLDQEIVAAKQIDEFVSQAQKLYDDFKYDSAAAIMKEAMSVISAFDATPAVAKKISEAYLTQGLIFDSLGKEKDSETSFLNAAALDSEKQLDPTRFSPGVIAKFYKAKENFKNIKSGSLRIETSPSVARIFVDGKDMGTTPATLKNLSLGSQKVSLVKEGFEVWEKNVMIVANSTEDYINKLALNLNKTGESVSLDALIGEVISKKDYPSQVSKLSDVGKLLLSDKVFAARLEKSSNGYDLFVLAVDTQTGNEFGRAYANIDESLSDYDVSIAHALQDLLNHQNPQQWTDLIAVEGKGTRYLASFKKQKPFYKTWPFYLIVGALIAGGGAGAAMAFKGDKSTPPEPTGSASVAGVPAP